MEGSPTPLSPSPPVPITVEGREYVTLRTFLGMAGGISRQRFWNLAARGRAVPEILRLGRLTLVPLEEGRRWIMEREMRKALQRLSAHRDASFNLQAQP